MTQEINILQLEDELSLGEAIEIKEDSESNDNLNEVTVNVGSNLNLVNTGELEVDIDALREVEELELELELELDGVSEETKQDIIDVDKPETNPIIFTEDETVNNKPNKILTSEQVTAHTETQQDNDFNIMDTLVNKMLTESLTDDDFISLCKIQKIDGRVILEESAKHGLSRDIIIYGKIMNKMGKPYNKQDGVYTYKTTGNIVEDLKNRLSITAPSLSETEYEAMCSFLGHTTESINTTSEKLWLSREEVLRGVLNKRMVGE